MNDGLEFYPRRPSKKERRQMQGQVKKAKVYSLG
jgi:hypothetical protein